jgi:hypothetical protein
MIGHQTVRPYLDSCFTSLLGQQIAINVVVPVLEKYRLPPVPALGHVMRKAGNHHAGKARHLGKLPQRKEKGDRYHVDASPPVVRKTMRASRLMQAKFHEHQ